MSLLINMYLRFQIYCWCSEDSAVMIEKYIAILISAVPILIPSLIKNLKFIAWLSLVANVCMIGGLLITLYYCFIDSSSNIVTADVKDYWATLPLFFGTTIFSFEGISLVGFRFWAKQK